MDLLAGAAAWLFSKAGQGFLDRFFTHLERKADSEVEKDKVVAARQNASEATSARVVMAGMGHKAFWIPWLIATMTVSLWFGWGVLDSLTNGLLPDVAELPPQLKEYADVVWNNIFYSGAAMGGAQLIARAIVRR